MKSWMGRTTGLSKGESIGEDSTGCSVRSFLPALIKLSTEIKALHFGITEQFLSCTRESIADQLHDVATIGDGQRLDSVLFYHQHRVALLFHLAELFIDERNEFGRQTKGWFIQENHARL